MGEELLIYDSVEVCFNGRPAVRNVSFSLNPGEILCIVGESGSGKSTLLRAAIGLLGRAGMVTRGDIWFQGENIPDLPKRRLRKIRGSRIGMIFQDPAASLCPVRTVGSQMTESLRAHGPISKKEAKERSLALFDKLGLKDGERIWECRPFELSGGMNQRVGIMMAMILKPDLLLADEPTSALDVTVQAQVVKEMMKMREMYGTAIGIVTHNIGLIEHMADKVAVMRQGRLVEYGTREEVTGSPRQEYTKELLGAVLRLNRGQR